MAARQENTRTNTNTMAGPTANIHSTAEFLGTAALSTRAEERRIMTCETTTARTADQKTTASSGPGIPNNHLPPSPEGVLRRTFGE